MSDGLGQLAFCLGFVGVCVGIIKLAGALEISNERRDWWGWSRWRTMGGSVIIIASGVGLVWAVTKLMGA